jgi:histone acetyltransferase (RNA polymerase elongator complex component)
MIIPFFIPHAGCPHQCLFCNQHGITGAASAEEPPNIPERVARFLAGAKRAEPAEVAFYGGSFTALPMERQEQLLTAVRPFIASGGVSSIRISTRPDCVTRAIAAFLKERGVATVELGAQSLDDGVLLRAGRGHSAADTEAACSLLREQGLRIGLQLMPGLPGDSREIFCRTVDLAIRLRPDCVRLYPALVIKETPMERLFHDGRFAPLPLDEAVAWCADALRRFRREGISVIRIGLQPTEELERPGTIVAGPYHPAFRQLVESSILLDRMRSALTGTQAGTAARFAVHPAELSSAIGLRKSNVLSLSREFHLARLSITSSPAVSRGEALLLP